MLAALVAAAPTFAPAHAEGKLEAHYGVTAAGLKVGKLEWSVDVGNQSYTSAATGRASGMLTAVVNGEGNVSARGAVKDGRLQPETYVSRIVHDKDKTETKMVLDGGEVKSVEAESETPAPDRVPVTDAQKHGVVDPATALLIPMAASSSGLGKDACKRTLPVFDGRRRFDLALSFKRMDRIKAEKGYAGPVVVCAVSFKPHGGHRASSKVVQFLTGGHAIELWLAPLAGARMLAPIRASVASMFGSLVIEATQFDVSTQTAAAVSR